jgi:hypothetical protein
VLFVGRGGGVGELAELVQSYVEARVERCVSKGYTIVYGDGVCILSLLARLKPNGDDCILITPLTVVADLAPSSKPAFVGAMPGIQVIAVRKGSTLYDELANFISGLCCGGSEELDIVVLGRSGRECYVETAGVWRGAAEEIARAISKVAVESMVKASEWLKDVGLYPDRRGYLERLLERVKALRSCDS